MEEHEDICVPIPPEDAVRLCLLLKHLSYKDKVKGIKDLDKLETRIRNALCKEGKPEIVTEILLNQTS